MWPHVAVNEERGGPQRSVSPVNIEDPGDGTENLFFFKPTEPEVLEVSLQEILGNWTSVNLVIKFPIWNASSSIYNILSLGGGGGGGSPVENQKFGSRK